MNVDRVPRSTGDEGAGGRLGGPKIVILACQVLQDPLERLLPEELADRVGYQDYGLHRQPGRLTETLQEQIDRIEEPSLVVLGYGLCGNGTDGIRAREHTLLIPRVDDCIALLLGSRRAYLREFRDEPATYYLSKGWLESGSHPLSEYQEYSEKYGAEDAQWIMDEQYQNYRRVALVAPTREDLEACRPKAREVAEYCRRWDMRYEEILGSDEYVRRLVEAISVLHRGGAAAADDIPRDFLVVTPGEEIRQEAFIL